MSGVTVEARKAGLEPQPFPIDFVDDIDGTTRHVQLGMPPFGTLAKLVFRRNLNPTEARLRRAIEKGGKTPEPEPWDDNTHCDDAINPLLIPYFLKISLHSRRLLMEGVKDSLGIIERGALQLNREIRFGNLSGRDPDLHTDTFIHQYRDGLTADQFYSRDSNLYLNPGVGSKNWKPYWIHSRLTGDRNPNQASNVVLREDDLEAAQLCAALQRLPEVQEVGTKVLVYWKQHVANPGILLWYGGVKLEPNIVSFTDHRFMAHDFVEKMRAGRI